MSYICIKELIDGFDTYMQESGWKTQGELIVKRNYNDFNAFLVISLKKDRTVSEAIECISSESIKNV